MNILIVCTYFPPQNSIASLRPYSWAKYWSRWGQNVTVVTTPKPFHPANLNLPYTGFNVCQIPIPGQRIYHFLLKSQDNKLNSRSAIVYSHFAKLLTSFLATLRKYGCFSARFPDQHDLWALRALSAVNHTRWDAVISTGWPYSTHFVGYSLKRQGNARIWVLDWRDLWTLCNYYPGLPIVRMLEQYIEQKFHSKADIITTVSEPLADLLRQRFGDKVKVIYNGFDEEDYDTLAEERIFPVDNVFRIVYTGTIYPNKRDPTPLFRAVKILEVQGKISPKVLQVVFAGYNADVADIAQREQVTEYVSHVGFVARQDALRMQRDANALLFLEDSEDPSRKGVLTGKLFEYLFAKAPIIAVGIDKYSEAGKIIQDSGRGYAYGKDSAKLAEDLSILLQKNTKFDVYGRFDLPPNIQQFSRAVQAKKLLDLISSL